MVEMASASAVAARPRSFLNSPGAFRLPRKRGRFPLFVLVSLRRALGCSPSFLPPLSNIRVVAEPRKAMGLVLREALWLWLRKHKIGADADVLDRIGANVQVRVVCGRFFSPHNQMGISLHRVENSAVFVALARLEACTYMRLTLLV
jgi:hypothetical protein